MGEPVSWILGASLLGAGVSAVSSYQSANAQKRQAEMQADMARYNASIAEQNAQNAEAEGREAKKTGYENAVKKWQEAAGILPRPVASPWCCSNNIRDSFSMEIYCGYREGQEHFNFEILAA